MNESEKFFEEEPSVPEDNADDIEDMIDPSELETVEQELSAEIADDLSTLEQTIENIDSLKEEPMSDTLKDRLLSSIDKIGDNLKQKFVKHLGGTALAAGIFGFQEYLINSEQTIVEEGSLLGDVNEMVLAATAVYATIKTLQFGGQKIEQWQMKRRAERGTKDDAGKIASYITKRPDDVHHDDLDITHNEHMSLSDEFLEVFEEEYEGNSKFFQLENPEEFSEQYKRAMKRISTELHSKLA